MRATVALGAVGRRADLHVEVFEDLLVGGEPARSLTESWFQWVGTTSVNLTGGRVLGGGNLITNSAALNSDVIHVIQGYQSIDLVT